MILALLFKWNSINDEINCQNNIIKVGDKT